MCRADRATDIRRTVAACQLLAVMGFAARPRFTALSRITTGGIGPYAHGQKKGQATNYACEFQHFQHLRYVKNWILVSEYPIATWTKKQPQIESQEI